MGAVTEPSVLLLRPRWMGSKAFLSLASKPRMFCWTQKRNLTKRFWEFVDGRLVFFFCWNEALLTFSPFLSVCLLTLKRRRLFRSCVHNNNNNNNNYNSRNNSSSNIRGKTLKQSLSRLEHGLLCLSSLLEWCGWRSPRSNPSSLISTLYHRINHSCSFHSVVSI